MRRGKRTRPFSSKQAIELWRMHHTYMGTVSIAKDITETKEKRRPRME